MSNNRTKTKQKRGMSGAAKWIITLLLFIAAVFTVLICFEAGNFSFKPGSVQANDDDVQETAAPKETEETGETVEQHRLFISSSKGGSASPDGCVTVEDWGSLTVCFTPDEGYELQSVTVDGENVGAMSAYTVSYVREDHVIIAKFAKIPTETDDPTEGDDDDDDPGQDITEYFGDD